MSDISQGDGWWQASDGKWYSPEQHPGAVTDAGKGGRFQKLAGKAKSVAEAEVEKRRSQSARVTSAAATTTSSELLLEVTSRDAGRNSQVKIFSDRIEQVQPKKIGSVVKANNSTQIIPMSTVSSVKTEKDGVRSTKVICASSSGEIVFRLKHDDATAASQVLGSLLVKRENHLRAGAGAASSHGTPAAAVSGSVADELKKLAELHSQGILSDEEFSTQKARLLS